MARQPGAGEPPAHVVPQHQRALLAAAAAGEPEQQHAAPHAGQDRERHDNLPRREHVQAEVAPHRSLPFVVEIDDVAPPAVIDGVEHEADVLAPAAVEAREQRNRLARRKGAGKPALDARWRHRRRRIVAMPAAVDQRFGPGMRVGLPDDQVTAARIDFPALIAGDDARRNARGAQHHDEGAGIVLAKAAARIEHELVDGFLFVQRRPQRVDERLVAKVRQHGVDERRFVRHALAQFAGEGDGALIARRQPQVGANFLGRRRREAVARDGQHRIAQRLRHRRARDKLLVAREPEENRRRCDAAVVVARARQDRGEIEREEPRLVARLHRHRVGERRRVVGRERAVQQRQRPDAPDPAVEARQHRPAPVAL